ncbi:MAG: PEGA domain-containing protein [Deltaproteobacteria bacterium]|nr:PEGA domain-containing protein [Deltaproteobacteria bacterium]
MIDRENRTFICSVVYYDIANYSTKSVEVQIRLKDQLNQFTTEAIKNVAVNDRIILDTGDGAAICFLGDPEDALFVAMSLRDAVLGAADHFTDDPLLVRFGINLGPVKVVNDINNRENIIGDGINVGQRVMSFAEPGQILVSRSYYEVVSCLTQEYARLFHYLGTRSDKHVRQHEVYAVLRPSELANDESAAESPGQDEKFQDRKNTVKTTRIAPSSSPHALKQNYRKGIRNSASASDRQRHWWQTKTFIFGGVTMAIFLAVILSYVMHRNFGEIQLDKTALSPEAPVTSPDKLPPENTHSAENVNPVQTESPMPSPPVPSITPQQESPSELPPESVQPKENAGPDQTESPMPPPPVPNIIPQQENPGELPPESAQPKERAVPVQTVQPHSTPSVSNGIIQFAITPWGEVFVDGKSHGASPPFTSLSVAPGKHVIEIINSAFPPFSQTIEIESDELLKFSHKFK